MVKTLNYIKELQDPGAVHVTPRSNTTPGSSPRKRKARGMFINDDTSSEIIIVSEKTRQKQVLLFVSLLLILL